MLRQGAPTTTPAELAGWAASLGRAMELRASSGWPELRVAGWWRLQRQGSGSQGFSKPADDR
jgi:hypothetical protein